MVRPLSAPGGRVSSHWAAASAPRGSHSRTVLTRSRPRSTGLSGAQRLAASASAAELHGLSLTGTRQGAQSAKPRRRRQPAVGSGAAAARRLPIARAFRSDALDLEVGMAQQLRQLDVLEDNNQASPGVLSVAQRRFDVVSETFDAVITKDRVFGPVLYRIKKALGELTVLGAAAAPAAAVPAADTVKTAADARCESEDKLRLALEVATTNLVKANEEKAALQRQLERKDIEIEWLQEQVLQADPGLVPQRELLQAAGELQASGYAANHRSTGEDVDPVEELRADNHALRAETAKLRDELAVLQGILEKVAHESAVAAADGVTASPAPSPAPAAPSPAAPAAADAGDGAVVINAAAAAADDDSDDSDAASDDSDFITIYYPQDNVARRPSSIPALRLDRVAGQQQQDYQDEFMSHKDEWSKSWREEAEEMPTNTS